MAEEQQSGVSWSRGLDGPALRIASSNATPLRVTAGPGTGKTFTLMRRVARLLEEGADAERILVISFTRTASRDLTGEILRLKVDGVEKVASGTLHSHCYKTLMRGSVLALTDRVARTLLPFEERYLQEDLKIAGTRSVHQCRRMVSAFEADWARLQHEEPGWPANPSDNAFHQDLMGWLLFHRSMLIGELPTQMLRYLQQNPAATERREFDHILVDEYQDLNRADQAVIDLLGENSTLTVIGDEDQSIYGRLRYAQPEGIRDFAEYHDHTSSESLEICRRCPAPVVTMANHLIAYNTGREERSLTPHDPQREGFVRIVQWLTLEDEVAGLARFVRKYLDEHPDTKARDILLLTPRRPHGLLLKKALEEQGVAALSYFFEESLRSETAQERYTLLSLVVNPQDRVSLRCWLGFGHSSMAVSPYKKLREYCEREGVEVTDAVERIASGQLRFASSPRLLARYELLKAEIARVQDLTGRDLIDALFPDGQQETFELRSIGQALLTRGEEDVTPASLLEAIRDRIINPEPPEAEDKVRIMSPYKAKGLTVKMTIIAGAVDSWMPMIDEEDTEVERRRQVEEQRRLFYVAITRPTEALVISSFISMPLATLYGTLGGARQTANGRGIGSASPFVRELGPTAPQPVMGSTLLS